MLRIFGYTLDHPVEDNEFVELTPPRWSSMFLSPRPNVRAEESSHLCGGAGEYTPVQHRLGRSEDAHFLVFLFARREVQPVL